MLTVEGMMIGITTMRVVGGGAEAQVLVVEGDAAGALVAGGTEVLSGTSGFCDNYSMPLPLRFLIAFYFIFIAYVNNDSADPGFPAWVRTGER
ncbi:hypothetical protein LIER_38025 [Lithospermum erythrorhizon]|uniref:Uncharacterized protein n=1 Tax=Lithospermum erythrorhizon TaxID=34254 RepID=A0AAV3PWQ1_LITER